MQQQIPHPYSLDIAAQQQLAEFTGCVIGLLSNLDQNQYR